MRSFKATHVIPLTITIATASILSISCKEDKKIIKTVEIPFTKEGELTLYKSSTDTIISKLNIEIADTEYDTQTGLMYRNSMKENRGMLFVFKNFQPRSFYMKNTKFPLDLIYLDEDKTIVSFQENAQPLDESSLPSNAPAKYVLEVNAGLVKKWGLKKGDSMQYTDLQQ